MKTQYLSKLFVSLLMTFFCLIVSSNSFAEKSKTKDNATYLFTQSAPEAILEANKDKGEPNTYLLTLKHVGPFVSYFSERPQRKAGVLAIEKFLSLWEQKGNNSFREDPPNAEIYAMEATPNKTEKSLNFSLEIIKPLYDKEAKTLTYVIKPLKGGSETPIPASTTLNHVILFIDDACLSCW